MSSDLVFKMGEYEARFPTDRRYARNHMWGSQRDGLVRFGFTAYAVRLMLDVYFLEWQVDAGNLLEHRQEIGAIESKKAESSLYAPIPGRLVRFNEALTCGPFRHQPGQLRRRLAVRDGRLLRPTAVPGRLSHPLDRRLGDHTENDPRTT